MSNRIRSYSAKRNESVEIWKDSGDSALTGLYPESPILRICPESFTRFPDENQLGFFSFFHERCKNYVYYKVRALISLYFLDINFLHQDGELRILDLG